jgi:hypothetical protein
MNRPNLVLVVRWLLALLVIVGIGVSQLTAVIFAMFPSFSRLRKRAETSNQ